MYFCPMPGNSFGQIFKVSTFGESHGSGIGAVIDGCPAGLEVSIEKIQEDLDRRKPGQSKLSSPRKESDQVQVLSGIFEGVSTGAPIALFIPNADQRPKDYSHIKDSFRPSHADFTYEAKYGLRDYRGGGRSSARETAARVAAGSIAKQLLESFNISILGFVSRVGGEEIQVSDNQFSRSDVEASIVRCPDPASSQRMENLIEEVKKKGDSLGGAIRCIVNNPPVGLGEPVFDKLHADLGKAMMSINAVKGFEIGSGIEGTKRMGSEENDIFEDSGGEVKTRTNNSGGIQGGISNGMPIVFTTHFKPVATLMRDQESVDKDGNEVVIEGKGRHDPCVVPRAVPIVEAMAALTLVDHLLRNRSAKI